MKTYYGDESRQEVYETVGREQLAAQDYKQAAVREQGLELKQMPRQCESCPWGPNRGKCVTDKVMDEVEKRIRGGERWICHRTCGPGGSVNESTQYCAGAPTPQEAIDMADWQNRVNFSDLLPADDAIFTADMATVAGKCADRLEEMKPHLKFGEITEAEAKDDIRYDLELIIEALRQVDDVDGFNDQMAELYDLGDRHVGGPPTGYSSQKFMWIETEMAMPDDSTSKPEAPEAEATSSAAGGDVEGTCSE